MIFCSVIFFGETIWQNLERKQNFRNLTEFENKTITWNDKNILIIRYCLYKFSIVKYIIQKVSESLKVYRKIASNRIVIKFEFKSMFYGLSSPLFALSLSQHITLKEFLTTNCNPHARMIQTRVEGYNWLWNDEWLGVTYTSSCNPAG